MSGMLQLLLVLLLLPLLYDATVVRL